MGYRVLIVDDSTFTGAFLQEHLEKLGHEVAATVATGREAIKAFSQLKPDLVTLDLSLPDMDGFSVLEEVRRLDPAVNVILITGNTQAKVLEKAKTLNVAATLYKPFNLKDIASALAEMPGAIKLSPP